MSELTAGQLTALRSQGQSTELFLKFLQPATIFACQVDQSFDTHDMVSEFIYDTATGDYADIVPGMTAFVGSTEGASDLGVVRIRKDATSTVIYIGAVSSIDWADDLHITVLDDLSGLFQRHIAVDENGAVLIDTEEVYFDQHDNFDPVPIMGSHTVLELSGGVVDIDLDASDSWVVDSTITDYSWAVSPAAGVTVTGPTTATPNIEFTLPETYTIRCTVTAGNGKTFTGTRYSFVFDETELPVSEFELISQSDSLETGGGVFQVRLYDQSVVDAVRDRTLCILFARDVYEGTVGSIGLLSGSENIINAGWIGGESIRQDPEKDSTLFTVYGAHWWLSKMTSFPITLTLSEGEPASWVEIQSLTVDKALWHLCHWRTTLTAITDVFLTGDDRNAATLEALGASLWEQLHEIAGKILASPLSDRFSRLFVDIPHNLRETADRSDSLDIMEITTADHEKTLDAAKSPAQVSQINLQSQFVTEEGDTSTLYSLAAGHIPGDQGSPEIIDLALCSSQSQANSMAGLLLGLRNNEYDNVPIEFRGNNRVFGIAPRQYATVDNDIFTGKLIPRRIERRFDKQNRDLTTTVIFFGETIEQPSTNGDIPIGDEFIELPGLPELPDLPELPELPEIIDITGIDPPIVVTPCSAEYTLNHFPASWSRTFLDGGDAGKLSAFYYVSCKVRASSDANPTYITFYGDWDGDAKASYHVYGLLAGARVLTATVTQANNSNRAWFDPVSETEVDGFEIALDAGAGSPVGSPGALITSGFIPATDTSKTQITVPENTDLCVENTGDIWYWDTEPGYSWPRTDVILFEADDGPGGVRLTGKCGSAGYPGPPVNYALLGTLGVLGELLTATTARVYFNSGAHTTVWGMMSDGAYADNPATNSGKVGYIIRHANISSSRTIQIIKSTLHNVCAV